MSERWIVIPRWDEFQHRDAARSNVPTWIKAYTRLLSDDAYLALTLHQRGILHGLWLEYARARRQLRDSTVGLSRRLGQRVTTRDLESLNKAGFIHLSASRPASDHASEPASSEERREDNPLSPFGETPPSAPPNRPSRRDNRCPHCPYTANTTRALTDHLELAHPDAHTATVDPSVNGHELYTPAQQADLTSRLNQAQPATHTEEDEPWPFSET